ncbi:MAG: type I-C CRISPR-associated protein Cas7/Csd2 [Bdellovibrionota bacterium]|nr:type I-C CRISPR-associated protein Cas7/Csd2 [Pseudomonadota bacterium]MDY6091442.1 type I-C CRISPR-associated protein Cas7/Csd2 [Bdellovibrionota bacterium]
MSSIENKIDFAVIFSVKNANPNGDPLNGNRPRQTFYGLGEVSDVALKRKIRNRLQDMGEKIFVQSSEKSDDGCKSLNERFKKFQDTFDKNVKDNEDKVRALINENWIDVRAFGQVFAFKGDSLSLGIRGPVTIQSAFSISPVDITTMQIVKSVNSEDTGSSKKASDTMGSKHRVDEGIYVTYGAINPQLAEKTGFSMDDADKVKAALQSLFQNDASSARPEGSMEVKKVIWWKHNSKSGQYSSAQVHNSLKVNSDGSYDITKLENLNYEELDGAVKEK